MHKTEPETFTPASRQEWRDWLEQNHNARQSVWLIYYKKSSALPTLTYNDAVDEALCFGWIDSTRRSVDQQTFMQFFCKRKPTSVWSKVNKAKVNHLINEGLMMPAGDKSIEIARQNGSWAVLDEVEELVVPTYLELALQGCPGAEDYFLSLSRSVRKRILQWLVLAKRAETRQKRISEIAVLAAQKQKPKQFI